MIGPDDARLDGKLAVVTGAAVGIGEAVAHALAGFGCELALCDRDDGNLATTVAPRAANPSASAAPMPEDAPVTRTCLPSTE